MTFCDAHFHIVQCGRKPSLSAMEDGTMYYGCTCAHDPAEFAEQEKVLSSSTPGQYFVKSFGIHPQNPDSLFVPFLKKLLEFNKIDAIGETGFDQYTDEYRSMIEIQENVWNMQVSLAVTFKKPLIIHCRKSIEKIFRDSKRLQAVPCIIFHSFPGSPADAKSLLRHGLNAYFSFGKQLLNGKKSSLACLETLELSRLLFETDAPFQTLKNESKTDPEEIVRIYHKAAQIRQCSVELLSRQLEKNFKSAYGISGAK